MNTNFFTNEGDNTLLRKFNGAFENIANLYAFHAVVGYFRSSGYFAIRKHLLKLPEVKILVGIDVDKICADAKRRGMMFFGDGERSRDEFIKWTRLDIQQADYSKDVENGIMDFLEDIISGKLKIRIHNTKKLHAKIYIFLPAGFNEYTGGEVITGSSNLTDNGLGNKDDANYEFNVALRAYEDVQFAENEFQRLWEQGEEILPIDVERIKQKTHLGQLYSPFEIYVKLLIEYFDKNIDYDPDTVGDLPPSFKKLSYQVDAVNQGYQMLLDHNGFMLADVVGLGKTVIAAMVAKRFLISNGTMSTKILVVYPPHLEKNWRDTFGLFKIDKHVKFVSNGSLHKILNATNGYWPKEDYDLVLVDESHKFRNHKSQMFNNLQAICKSPRAVEGNVPGLRKKVILISATPLNNRPEDIYYQLLLFQDARRSTLPVTNLQSFFAPIIREYKEIMASAKLTGKPEINRLRSIYGLIRVKVIESITVRRTRTDIEKYPDYKKDLEEQGIKFPDIADPRAIEYFLDEELSDLFLRTIICLIDSNRIGYFRYRAIEFLLPEIQEKYYTQAERASKTLAHIMMVQMVKRLESSFFAFKNSLFRFMTSTERMIEMFERGKIFVAPDLKINELMDKDWSDEDIEELIWTMSEEDSRNQVFTPGDFKPEFFHDLKNDFENIKAIYEEWMNVEEDPKFDRFLHLLNTDLLRKDINPTGKLVVFSESKETAKYLETKLHENGFGRILNVSSDNRKQIFEDILANFDANYSKPYRYDYDVLITTEVLAEGINLHRANILVNYDTPWNASKLMQRLGRVNRIGSIAAVIYHYAFYPSSQSDKLINLYNNAYIKLQSFHTAYGEDSRIYTTQEVLEEVKLHTRGQKEEEDKRLIYLRFIRDFKTDHEAEFRRIQKLPMKARTGRSALLAQKDGAEGNSFVFMKSPYKLEFYRIHRNQKVEALSFIHAVEFFEATVHEVAEHLPDFHHGHIKLAEHFFEQELVASSSDAISGEKSDVTSNLAKKYLRSLRSESTDEKLRGALTELINLLEKGTITSLPDEIKKLKQKADKSDLKLHQIHALIMKIALKYLNTTPDVDDDDMKDMPELPSFITQKAEIIISETFSDTLIP